MISIAMATYNGEKYLAEQVDSILAQTLTDWELVICDDCSNDATWHILEDYASKDSRIKVYRNEHNLGFKKNFEKAIGLCKGEYIALSDQDDVWFKNHLEFLLNQIGEKGISGANAVLVDENGNHKGKLLNEADGLMFFPADDTFLYRIIFTGGPIQGAAMLIKKVFLKKCLPIPEHVSFHDAWFIACACLDGGIAYSFEPISNYRQHGNNITFLAHNKTHEPIFKSAKKIAKKLLNGTVVDRFEYCCELEKRFGHKSKTFKEILSVMEMLRQKKSRVRLTKFFWNKYELIRTRKGHKKFIKRLVAWFRWVDYE